MTKHLNFSLMIKLMELFDLGTCLHLSTFQNNHPDTKTDCVSCNPETASDAMHQTAIQLSPLQMLLLVMLASQTVLMQIG